MDFYYDESYQCSALNFDGQNINISNQSNPEFYIGCFIGSADWNSLIPSLLKLEQKYKTENGFDADGELKSSNLLKTQDVKNGFSSLSHRAISFYQSLFNILNEHITIHFVVFNKYEEVIEKAFPDAAWFDRHHYNYRFFIYGLTKFFKHHQDYDILSVLYSYRNSKWRVKQLTIILENHLKKIQYLDKKKEEMCAIQGWIHIINRHDFYLVNIKSKIIWDYNKIACSFKNFCQSQNIIPNDIGIDNHQQTVECMRSVFSQARDVDSKTIDNIQVRVCDWIVGFVGRIMLAYDSIMTNKSNQSIEFSETLPLLSDTCFDLNQEQIDLVLLAYRLLLEQQESFWSMTTSLYADMVGIFYEFIRYVQKCNASSIKMNANDFNEDLIYELHCQFINSKGD